MKRTFLIRIPFSLEKSYDLVEKSGTSILSWHKQTANRDHYYLEWKQSIWSFSGSAVIVARLEKVEKEETRVIIDVIKPFQFFDPLNICEKVFKKLESALGDSIEAVASRD